MENILSIVGLALLGLLVLMILKNMLWGMKRGAKSTLVRIIVMIGVSLLLLVLTPVISKMLWNIFLEDLMGDMAGIEDLTSSMSEGMTDSSLSGLLNFPLVVVNIVVFIVLQLTLFKWISYLIFRIIAKFVAPRKDKETGEKIQHSKLFGMLMGIAQGVVAFFFFMLPINALVYSVNVIERYQPTLSPSLDIYEDSTLADVNTAIREIDQGLNTYGYVTITRFTGLQWASGVLSGPLYTIPETSVNVRADVVTLMQLARDADHAIELFNTGRQLTAADFDEFDRIIDNVFDMTLVKMLCEANPGTMLDELGMFDDALSGLTATEKTTVIENLNDYFAEDGLRDDLKKTVSSVSLLFTKIPTAENKTFVDILGDFFTALGLDELGLGEEGSNNSTDITTATTNMRAALDYIPSGETKTLSTLFFVDGIGQIGLFKDLLFGNDIHAVLISDFVGVSVEEARIDNFQAVMSSIQELLDELANVAPDFSSFMDAVGGEGEGGFEDLTDMFTDTEFTTSIANVLGALTNPKKACEFDDAITHDPSTCECELVWGISKIVRTVMSDAFAGMRGESAPASDELSIDAITYDVLNALVTELKSSRTLLWDDTLSMFGELTSLFELDFEEGIDSLDAIIKVLDGDEANPEDEGLLKKMERNPVFKPVADKFDGIIKGFIEDVIDETLSELGMNIDFGDLDGTEIIKLTLKIQENLSEVGEKIESGEINFDTADGVSTLLDTAGGTLDELANSGVKITNPEWTNPETGDVIDVSGQTDLIQAEIEKLATTDPERAEQMQSWLWVLGLPSTWTPASGN